MLPKVGVVAVQELSEPVDGLELVVAAVLKEGVGLGWWGWMAGGGGGRWVAGMGVVVGPTSDTSLTRITTHNYA